MRPKSVILAERLYLLAAALLLATSAMTWGAMVAQFGFGVSLGATVFIIGLIVLLTLGATRRRGRAALWLLVLVTVFVVASLAWQVASLQLAGGVLGVLNAAQAVLMLVGAVLLFRPSARAWFAEPRDWEDEA